jgi:predicted SnoaL-like aldol condensation-catalyzing enzyme
LKTEGKFAIAFGRIEARMKLTRGRGVWPTEKCSKLSQEDRPCGFPFEQEVIAAFHTQHNPVIPDGPLAIAKMIPTLTALTYEPGMVVADGDLVMVHGRYTGWGPKPMVAVDIFRVKGGKVVEHWDVMQEEVSTADTASGHAMFTQPD